jgi:hypothetical protein
MLARGRLVDMFYEPVAGGAVLRRRTEQGPHFTVSKQRCGEIQREAPHGLRDSTFRVVRDYGSVVDLEWV